MSRRLIQLAITPQTATTMTPVQDHASASTRSGEAAPAARPSVVRDPLPVAASAEQNSHDEQRDQHVTRDAQRRSAILRPDGRR